jgi:signal transduction histidine kinase
MESKLSGALATASNAASRVKHALTPVVRLADRVGRRASLPRATAEVTIAAALFAALYYRLSLVPSGSTAAAFLMLVCSSMFLGAFRLSRSRPWLRGAARELVALTIMLAPTLATQVWIRSADSTPSLRTANILLAVAAADIAVYVVGRFLVVALPWWLRFNQKRLRWQLVQAHITVVLIICSIPTALILLVIYRDSGPRDGSGIVENVVLRFAINTIVALSAIVVFFGFALILVVPPSIALSYVVARRMTKRLEKLATATTAIREGDYSARVVVQGADEVAQLQTNFNAMAGVLETAIAETAEERDKIAHLLDQRRELVASVSHELRTPLTIIRGYLDSTLGQNAGLTPELQRDLTVMHGEALRLQRLIDDLFALSRAEVGSLTLHPRECDVAAMLRRCAEASSPAAWRTHRIEILVDSEDPLPTINVDPDRLEQVIFNLINNAVRHSPPGGLVQLSAERAGDFIQIEIADTGEGIAPDELNSIWDRFYRGRNAKDVRGSGIGLAIVRELTEAMEGHVSVASTLGEGTVFTLRFPIDHDLPALVDEQAETRAIPQTTPRQSTANAQT